MSFEFHIPRGGNVWKDAYKIRELKQRAVARRVARLGDGFQPAVDSSSL
jgi:hypothetical protein